MEPLYVIDFWSYEKSDPTKAITDVVMFDGAPNVKLGGELLKIYDPHFIVMCGVGHTVSLFFKWFPQNTKI